MRITLTANSKQQNLFLRKEVFLKNETVVVCLGQGVCKSLPTYTYKYPLYSCLLIYCIHVTSQNICKAECKI